jgi:6-pyruvoyltetrahydropterin/6-carboxytetrahydropterin synthase
MMSIGESGALRLTREVHQPLPSEAGATRFFDLCWRVTVSGPVDPGTGYIVDAGDLDGWLIRQAGPPPDSDTAIGAHLSATWVRLAASTPTGLALEGLDLRILPTWRWAMHRLDGEASQALAVMTRRFHFAAAHRLHNPSWPDEVNARVFGRCGNEAGHGHNYMLELSIPAEREAEAARVENIVSRAILPMFDHRHLNVDVPEMKGINPTVEALTDLIWNVLDSATPSLTIWSVRLYETPKISAERRRAR